MIMILVVKFVVVSDIMNMVVVNLLCFFVYIYRIRVLLVVLMMLKKDSMFIMVWMGFLFLEFVLLMLVVFVDRVVVFIMLFYLKL